MTPVRYQAIYARSDREAARKYRLQLDSWLARRDSDETSKEQGVAEIDAAARAELLNNKPTSEARQVLHS